MGQALSYRNLKWKVERDATTLKRVLEVSRVFRSGKNFHNHKPSTIFNIREEQREVEGCLWPEPQLVGKMGAGTQVLQLLKLVLLLSKPAALFIKLSEGHLSVNRDLSDAIIMQNSTVKLK